MLQFRSFRYQNSCIVFLKLYSLAEPNGMGLELSLEEPKGMGLEIPLPHKISNV